MFALAIAFAILALLAIGLVLYINSQYRRAGEKLIGLPLSKTKQFACVALGIPLLIIGNQINYKLKLSTIKTMQRPSNLILAFILAIALG